MPKNAFLTNTQTDSPGSAGSDEEREILPASDLQSPPEYARSGPVRSTRTQSESSRENTDSLFEPVARHPYDLSYACLLIPRFGNHYLSGDLVDYLYGWMHDACISFSWRLESLDIQTAYVQWLLSVPAAVPPAHFIRILRHHTSSRIFEEFPRFKKENISGDFWAPGHLVIVGRRLHSPEMISEFIKLTRQQQGMAFIHRR